MRYNKYILPAVFFVFLGIFVLYPTVSVLQKSFITDGNFSFHNYLEVFSKPHLYSTIGSSALVALGAATLSTLLGLIIAVVVFKTRTPLRKLFAVTAVLPVIIPGFVTTIAYIFLFGRNGVISYHLLGITWDVYSWKSVLLLQSLDLTTTAFLLISATMFTLDSSLEDAARSLGSSEWHVFRTVTLPLLRPGLIAAALLTFMRSIADFGTPIIVGGKFDTLASASYTQLIGTYNMEIASTLNMILLIITVVAFWLYTKGQARVQNVRQQTSGDWGKEIRFARPVKSAFGGISALFSIIVLMMLVSVFLSAFTRHIGGDYSLTWAHFQILPQRGWNSSVNTIMFAFTTMVVVSFLGILIAYFVSRIEFRGKRILDWLTTLPFAIPGTFMGIGFAIAFSRSPFLLAGTWLIVVACTVIRELPLGLRAGVSVLSQQDSSVEDAAASLGASKLVSFFNVTLPMARSALMVTAAWAFIATVQTLGAIIFIITPGTKLLSVDVFEAVIRNDWGDAAAFSVVMMLLAAAGILCIYLVSRRQATESWFRRIIAGHGQT